MAIKIKHSGGQRVMGIDPSTFTGLALIDRASGETRTRLLNFPKLKGMDRISALHSGFAGVLGAWDPDLAVIEGYGFGNQHSLVLMAEISIGFRLALYAARVPWYIAPPTVLKKYATGKGVASKPQILSAVKARWGFESPSDDVVDAYVLAQIGCGVAINGLAALEGVERG